MGHSKEYTNQTAMVAKCSANLDLDGTESKGESFDIMGVIGSLASSHDLPSLARIPGLGVPLRALEWVMGWKME